MTFLNDQIPKFTFKIPSAQYIYGADLTSRRLVKRHSRNNDIWCYWLPTQYDHTASEQWTILWTLHNLSILCVCLCCVFCLYRVNQCRQLTVRQQRIVRVHQGFIPHRPAAMPNEDDVMKKTSSRLTTWVLSHDDDILVSVPQSPNKLRLLNWQP